MSRIRNRDTAPEKAVRSLLHRLGYRFRLHREDFPGKPDIVLPRFHTVIFVHGCFWHRHRGCKYAYIPKSRTEFWEQKFTDNVECDRRSGQSIRKLGWRVIIIWECEISNLSSLSKKIRRLLPDQ